MGLGKPSSSLLVEGESNGRSIDGVYGGVGREFGAGLWGIE